MKRTWNRRRKNNQRNDEITAPGNRRTTGNMKKHEI